ncbi:MAG: site-specific integrase [Woeseia sp.]
MPRTIRNPSLETRSARIKLTEGKRYFTPVDEGVQLGYRRSKSKSVWIARLYAGKKKYRMRTLGLADDYRGADGRHVLTYFQAAELARERSKDAVDKPLVPRSGKIVRDATEAYLAKLESKGRKSVAETRRLIDRDILPDWATVPLADVTSRQIHLWRAGLMRAPRRSRAGKERPIDDSPEGQRKRRSTAQRKWNVLRAVLNTAADEGWADRRIWSGIGNLEDIDPPADDFPTLAECKRLARRTAAEFRPVVEATFLCGAAFGELRSMRVRDFMGSGHIRVFNSKRQARDIPLTPEGVALFDELTAGKRADEPIFTHADGRPWGKSEQHRPIREANRKAKIDPPITLTRLRKAYGSLLLNAGVPLLIVSRAMGHHDPKVTEKHYARLLSKTVDDQIRGALPSLGRRWRKVSRLG